MPMYNLIEYSSNYFATTESLWFYSKDEVANLNANIANTDNFRCFKYKAKLLETTVAQATPNNCIGILKNATVAVPLKYLSNFCRSLKMQFISFKVELKLKWTNCCVLSVARNDNDGNKLFLLSKTQKYMFWSSL